MKNTLLFILCLLHTCPSTAQYLIKCRLTGFANGTKFYLMDNTTFKNIDSAIIQNNFFTMRGKLFQPPRDLLLYVEKENESNALRYAEKASQHIALLIANDTIQINGDAKALPYDMSITGSKIQDEENGLNTLLKANNKKILSLYNKDASNAMYMQNSIEAGDLEQKNTKLRREFAFHHLNTYAGLKALQPFTSISTDTLWQIYNKLTSELKNCEYGGRLAAYLKSLAYLKTGSFITDFAIQNKTGVTRHLFDYKGQYLLLYFYTSVNCPLCEGELSDLKNIQNKFRNKITIIAISTDSSKNAWLNGLDKDPLWPTYWAGVKNTAMEDNYGPYLSPAYYLVDTQSKIMYIHLGYGNYSGNEGPLERTVKEILK